MVVSSPHGTRRHNHWIAMATSQRGGLKRKYCFPDEDAIYSSSSPSSHSEWDTDEENPQSDSVNFGPAGSFSSSHHMSMSSILKKKKDTQSKGSVRFGLVTVFLFQRCQGFSSVPSHGGCTLGMVRRHAARQQFTLEEHAEEQLRLRMERLREQQQEERLEAMRQKLINSGTLTVTEAARLTANDVPDEDADLSSTELKDLGSPRLYSSKQRRELLRAAGVVRIDREEKRQLKDLRRWREDCGCHCQGFCEPETCACSQAGIQCQMDRSNFPCGCSKECCGNPAGRIEFNPSRVQSHYIHTHMKLELEKRLHDDNRPTATEQQSVERNRAITFPAENDSPSFPLSSELCRQRDNSWNSDVTDTSCSSSLSLDSETDGGPSSRRPTLDMDSRGHTHILSFSNSDGEGCPYIKEYDLFTEASGGTSSKESNSSTSQVEYLDENDNQATRECVDDPFDIPNTPSASPDHSMNCYMDLSLSSGSDLVFFDTFHEYGLSRNHLKVCSHLDYMSPLQFPCCPSPTLTEDSGVSLLESLVGIS
ncbi:cysteine/serine-rich nuclear protein 3-like [Carassius auratus]|uniref:Cysteine/serine-rich nuclear protein 3-like n=1 Tax=Carassius auratus TaxID=7957 RepID=A0A6P6R4U4_CARAU|nr:cysteine/serine-rich nuclear protein 3-like [Carassius auratus]